MAQQFPLSNGGRQAQDQGFRVNALCHGLHLCGEVHVSEKVTRELIAAAAMAGPGGPGCRWGRAPAHGFLHIDLHIPLALFMICCSVVLVVCAKSNSDC